MNDHPLINRLAKNLKKLKSYLKKNEIEAYRIYHKDIPEYPYLIDIYGKQAVVYEQGKKLKDEELVIRKDHQIEIQNAIQAVFEISPDQQFFKVREKQKGSEQYRPLTEGTGEFSVIKEGKLKFWINLERYLDTGLFLDHRPLRHFLTQNTDGKKVLNLFCYTGSISVAAAMGGGRVTSIDMSRTYLDWAQENFKLNSINLDQHRFIQADVLQELKLMQNRVEFDVIILDPPSFSNSKRMEDDLDIDRDHPILIRDCMKILAPEGKLYFSTNKRKFELHSLVTNHYLVKEITQWTIPQDFHQTQIHRTFCIQYK